MIMNLTELNNKWYDKCNVMMLPAEISRFGFISESKTLHIIIGEDPNDLLDNLTNPQHLYITSDEVIEENDKVIDLKNHIILTVKSIEGERISVYEYPTVTVSKEIGEKIIATTDSSLSYNNYNDVDRIEDFEKFVPLLPNSFIKKYIENYNKGNEITDVLIEVEEYATETTYISGIDCSYPLFRLKLNTDNTINVIIPEQKKYERVLYDFLHYLHISTTVRINSSFKTLIDGYYNDIFYPDDDLNKKK